MERKQIRLKNFDYRQAGAYFVTICCNNRLPLLGSINDGVMSHSELGRLCGEMLGTIPEHRDNVYIDTHVIMPNHLHFILCLLPDATRPDVQLGKGVRSLGAIVGSYKSAVTREWRVRGNASKQIWQASFYEHVIRHEGAMHRVRDYIANNPLQWSLDRENQFRSGTNGFYGWMESYKGFLAQD